MNIYTQSYRDSGIDISMQHLGLLWLRIDSKENWPIERVKERLPPSVTHIFNFKATLMDDKILLTGDYYKAIR